MNPTKPKHSGQSAQLRRKLLHFPEAKGKTIEAVELSMATDHHAISINFQDQTCLHFSIETALTVKTDYSSWKSGQQRIIRRWRLMRSEQ